MRLVNSKYNLDISIIENVVNVIVIEKPETLAEFEIILYQILEILLNYRNMQS